MHDAPPIVNISGEKVVLGPLSKDVLPSITRWINDFHALRTLGVAQPAPSTFEEEEEWYASATRKGSGITFLIRERSSHLPVGTTSLHAVDYRNRATTFGILIGEHTARGQGYGTETAALMLDYAFNALGLHSVGLSVAEYNLAGRRAYEKAGFKECGRFRQRLWLGGKMWDQIHMDCLAPEFESPVLAAIFSPDAPN